MAKDIFGDDYFDRHRDSSSWTSLGKRKIHEALNIKHKPKPKLEEVLPAKEAVKPKVEEKIVDEEYKEHNKKVNSDWKVSYFKNVLAGLVGGFLVIIVQQMNVFTNDIASLEFWIDGGITVLIGLIFILLFGMIYKTADKQV